MYQDTLIRIKNASAVGKEKVKVSFTKLDASILNVLSNHHYIGAVTKKGRGVKKVLDIELSYKEGAPRVNEVRFVSKSQKRIYKGSSNLRVVRQGYGIGVVSTSKGVMTVDDARKQKVGGEYLFQIW